MGITKMRRGQLTIEAMVVLALITAALIASAFYLRRGVQGYLRESADSIGSQYDHPQMELDWLQVRTLETERRVERDEFGNKVTEPGPYWRGPAVDGDGQVVYYRSRHPFMKVKTDEYSRWEGHEELKPDEPEP